MSVTTEQQLRLANRLGALALHVSDRMAAATAAEAGRGATAPAALIALSRARRHPIEYLRHVLGLSHSATVRVIDRLSDDGLVRRGPGPDARTVSPQLTASGDEAAHRVERARADVLLGILTGLDNDDQAALARILDRLLAQAAVNDDDATHLCRLCDVPLCQQRDACPVDEGMAQRHGHP
jgi:DNA-binding MarR family transcriptional regulator